MNTLFEMEETLSPRREWMRKHNIKTRFRNDLGEDWDQPWEAYVGDYSEAVRWTFEDHNDYPENSPRLAFSDTEDGCLERLAVNAGIEIWYTRSIRSEWVNEDK